MTPFAQFDRVIWAPLRPLAIRRWLREHVKTMQPCGIIIIKTCRIARPVRSCDESANEQLLRRHSHPQREQQITPRVVLALQPGMGLDWATAFRGDVTDRPGLIS
jgi:hypothetical protein